MIQQIKIKNKNMSKYHKKRLDNPRYIGLSNATLEIIKFHPTLKKYSSIIDIGSSCGAFLKELNNHQSFDKLVGIDYSEDAEKLWCCKNGQFIRADLNKKESLKIIKENLSHTSFDVLNCTEVAEHLKTDDVILDLFEMLSNNNSILIFSAAIPGQRGRGHINCHWHGYWKEKIEARRWGYNHQMTANFVYEIGRYNYKEEIVPNYYLNTMIFQKALDKSSEDNLEHKK